MNDVLVSYLYVVSVVLFVLSLRWMSEVKTSQRGNWAGAAGLVVAIIGTLLAYQINRVDLLVAGFVIGALVGSPIALRLPMTAVPQRTAMSHAFGSLAVALIGASEYYNEAPNVSTFTMSVLSAEMILGFLTFTGSIIAFSKLQGLISGKPLIYPGRVYVSLSSLIIAIGLGVFFVANPADSFILPIMAVFALVGLILLYAAFRLVRKRHQQHHHRYTLPGH